MLQFMNHIPKGGSICRKDSLSRLLRCMRRIHGSIYDFSPPCFHLPLEYAKLVSECSRLRRLDEGTNVVWIHKPVAQSQGRGIFLFRSVCEMRCGSPAVVQRYIERPLLIAGYKFDLRLYVCVPTYRPLTAYMYAEGLARFGTDKYTLSDIHNPYRHLTNSSLNKTGPRYAECKDRIGSGCKWTLKQVRRALIGRWGAAEWLVWQRIRAIVNLSPALAADCEADLAVKPPMLHELFDLLGLPMRHTGLSYLQTHVPHISSSCSEDENGTPTLTSPPSSGYKRSGRQHRRRREMPVHCVTIQSPMLDKSVEQSTEKDNDAEPKSEQLYKPTSISENVERSPVSSEPAADETWRGGYATAASRRKMMNACMWGNGVRWDKGVNRIGNWLPYEDARESVAHISKFVRAAREVTRECGRDKRARDSSRDAHFEAALKKKLGFGSQFENWFPKHVVI
ncbi:unnamed protein product, partial [Leptidea sinapis]